MLIEDPLKPKNIITLAIITGNLINLGEGYIMGFSDFFKPKWKHSNSKMRISALAKITNTSILQKVINTDKDEHVRAFACCILGRNYFIEWRDSKTSPDSELLKKAKDALKMGIDIDPTVTAKAYNLLGIIYERIGNFFTGEYYHEAIVNYSKAVCLDPDDAQSLELLSSIKETVKEQFKNWKKYWENNPRDVESVIVEKMKSNLKDLQNIANGKDL